MYGEMGMKTKVSGWMKALLVGVLLVALVSGGVAYRYLTAEPLQLVVEASQDEEAPAVMRWAAVQGLQWRSPTAEEIASLNREAGARYLLELPDPQDASALLRHDLDHGLDLNSRDAQSGLTALQGAAIANEPAQVALLLGLGADPQVADSEGRTALMLVQLSQTNRPDVDYRQMLALLSPKT